MSFSRTGYGVDVSATRADELEKRLLAMAQPGETVLDLGCGAGGAAARLAAAGAAVVGIDVHDFSNDWLSEVGSFVQGDMRDLGSLLGDRQFDYCLCSRTIHYLRYEESVKFLRLLRRAVTRQLFISFSGLTSDLARGYEVKSEPVGSRFGALADAGQEMFGITAPLTLYTEVESIKLLTDTGWHVTWSRTTDFGNVLIQANHEEA